MFLQKVYVLMDNDPDDLGTPIVFGTVEAAQEFVSKENGDLQRDEHSTYEWAELMGMGVGRHWEQVWNGSITFTIYEQVVHESGDPRQVWKETG